MKNKVINYKNLPARFPLIQVFLVITAINYWNAPEWIYWAVWLFYSLAFVSAIIGLIKQEYINLDNK